MFASCHMCTHCGRELCGACYQQVEEMCPVGTPTQYSNGERKDPQLHKYRACAGRQFFHVPSHFRPITRFTREELEETVQDMEARIAATAPTEPPIASSGSGSVGIAKWASHVPAWNPTSPQASTEPPALSSAGSSHDVSSLRGTPDPLLASMPIIASPTMSPTHEDAFATDVGLEPSKRPVAAQHGRVDAAGVPTHTVNYFPKSLTEDVFKPIWARGETVVVQGLLEEFKIQWTPQYFIEEHGEQQCLVVNCQNDKVSETTVERFFEQFGKVDRGDEILKLKVSWYDPPRRIVADVTWRRRIGLLKQISVTISLICSTTSWTHCPYPTIHAGMASSTLLRTLRQTRSHRILVSRARVDFGIFTDDLFQVQKCIMPL